MKLTNFKISKKLVIIINLFLITALMTVSVYAWFASMVENRVDVYEITVESDNALELSFDGESWGGSLNLANYKDSNGDSVMEKIKFVEVDGDGTNFRIPQLTQKTNYAEVNTSADWSTAYANQDYLEFTVLMRSKDKMNVYLSSESVAKAVSSVLTGEGCGNPSTYSTGANSFSKDCIVGALRVSYENAAGTNYIWITNPEFHLNNKVGSPDYSMDAEATFGKYSDGTGAEGNDFYWNDPYKHYYYINQTKTTFANTLYELPESVNSKPGDSTLVGNLTTTQDSNGYYTDSVTFKVWVEGCDTEARRALVDGIFNLSLVFDTFGVE